MRKLFLVSTLCSLALAQTPPAGTKPLGKTRFPAAQNLEWKPTPVKQAPSEPKQTASKATLDPLKHQLVIVMAEKVCAHVKRVDPSPATDPKMVTGPPKGFESKMRVVQTMPACDEVAR
jgi:hypothetical protein